MDPKTTLTVVFLVFTCFEFTVIGVSIDVDLRLSHEQKKTLDKFKKIMIPKLSQPYMKEEIYLVRWLRARDFDLKKSEEFLLQNLKWRKQNKMDTIHEEIWTDLEQDFPYTIDTSDKRGQPVVAAVSRDWDIRNAVVTGRIRRVLRYLDKAMDEAGAKVRTLQLEGKNVTQYVLILQMGSFNLVQHGCPRCITAILEFLDSYDNHFPGMADKILLVNTPPVFEAIAKLVREAASPLTREALKIYGTDPKEWKTAIFDIINPNDISEDFGGNKPALRF